MKHSRISISRLYSGFFCFLFSVLATGSGYGDIVAFEPLMIFMGIRDGFHLTW